MEMEIQQEGDKNEIATASRRNHCRVSLCNSTHASERAIGRGKSTVGRGSLAMHRSEMGESVTATSDIASDRGEQSGDGRLCSGPAAAGWRSRARAAVLDRQQQNVGGLSPGCRR